MQNCKILVVRNMRNRCVIIIIVIMNMRNVKPEIILLELKQFSRFRTPSVFTCPGSESYDP